MSLFLRAGRKQRDAQRTDRLNTLIISGTVSQVCCEATARDAMMMNYKVFFITDACATMTDAEHGGTLSAMAHTFCDVRDTQSVLGLIAAA